MRKLFLIPARGGSKGLPRKNNLPLAGKPLIYYTLDAATQAAGKDDVVCVSTDDQEIIAEVESYGLKVPFVRPQELASDTASSHDVLKHALQWYAERNQHFDLIVLLQVTSPLRTAEHLNGALSLWTEGIEMVVSVKETDANPYYVLFEEDNDGFLQKSKEGNFTRRQDCPAVYEYNGAIYVIDATEILTKPLNELKRVIKYVMPKEASVDIDTRIDLDLAEIILAQA